MSVNGHPSADEPLDLRASPGLYIVLTAPWLAVGGLWAVPLNGSRGSWIAVAICLVMIGVVVVWLVRFRLRLDGDGVSYASLWAGRRSLALGEIDFFDWKSGPVTYADRFRFKPLVGLNIYPTNASGKRAITVNAKVFARRELVRFTELLESSIPKERPSTGR